MMNLTPLPHHIYVRMSEQDRVRIFEQEVKRGDGKVVTLTIDTQAGKGEDKAYSQSLSIGTVIAIADNISGISVGDIAILDYTIDHSDELIIVEKEDEKIVRVDTRTLYEHETLIADANRRNSGPKVVYYKGDLKNQTLLIATIGKDGSIKPSFPYLVLEHRKKKDEFVIQNNEWVPNEEDPFTDRKVVAVWEGSDYKPGDEVICEESGIFDRQINETYFDIVSEKDIAAVLLPQST
jgi:hypothetical protein